MKRRCLILLLGVSWVWGSLGAVPPGAPAGLPEWVPTTRGEAGFVPMTNTLDSVLLKGVWGDNAQSLGDYSGGRYNPHYGPWGAHIIHGGGHASSHDNSVILANFNTLAFERVGGPTQLATKEDYEDRILTGGFPDDISNPREVEPGVPGAAHTYDCLLVLPPSVCGDPLGALIRPVAGAVGMSASRETGWSHVFTFTDRKWSRWSTNHALSWTPGNTCAYDTSRGIIWPISEAYMNHRSYLTLSTRTYTNLPEQPHLHSYPDMVYSTYCAHRDAIVIATNDQQESSIRMYWFSGGSTGGDRIPVTFSNGPLPTASYGTGSLMYVPELQRIIYWTQAAMDTYFEIEVPSDPAGAWSWVARPITGAAKPSTLSPAPRHHTYHRMDYSAPLKSLVWVTGQVDVSRWGGRVVCIRVVDGTADTSAPGVPANLRARASSPSQIDLAWDASTDNAGVAGYRIYRDGIQIGSTAETTYSDRGRSPSTTYTYAVAAFDEAANVSATSSSVSATTPAEPSEGAGGGGGSSGRCGAGAGRCGALGLEALFLWGLARVRISKNPKTRFMRFWNLF